MTLDDMLIWPAHEQCSKRRSRLGGCSGELTAGWLLHQEHGTFIEGEQRRLLAAAEQPLALTWHGEGKGAAAAAAGGDEELPATGCEHIGVLSTL